MSQSQTNIKVSQLQFVWTKAILVQQQVVRGKELNWWKIKWLETGGFTNSENPHTIKNYFFSTRDMKMFNYGYGKYINVLPD